MANIFKQNLDVNEHPKRNNFDLTHKVHGSYKFGTIYPFLCKPVVPGDSFRIDTACGFQFMPMPFPTQSNMRVVFHYFYVRNKNIWENWQNFSEGLEEHETPYIDQPVEFYKSGSLADYLDIPTTLAVDGVVTGSLVPFNAAGAVLEIDDVPLATGSFPAANTPLYTIGVSTTGTATAQRYSVLLYRNHLPFENGFQFSNLTSFSTKMSMKKADMVSLKLDSSVNTFYPMIWVSYDGSYKNAVPVYRQYQPSTAVDGDVVEDAFTTRKFAVSSAVWYDIALQEQIAFDSMQSRIMELISVARSQGLTPTFFFALDVIVKGTSSFNPTFDASSVSDWLYGCFFSSVGSSIELFSASTVELSVLPDANPYYSSSNTGSNTVRVSALPFRAYESIYNAFYRNTVTQPFMIDGEKRYNRYNTNLGDGADTFNYKLEQRNWELDAYTSCLPSPQQGNAPLVGMNMLGEIAIEDENGITTAKYDEDGETGKVVVTSPLASVEHGRILMDIAQSGISINDFRQVNALQAYLEQNIRSGYKYVDYIKGQFGVKPKHNELDMPEFLGGFTQRVDVNSVTNTNGVIPDASDAFLGSYAGQARSFGGSPHAVSSYFDDYGFVIGVMMVVPDAAYSQILPKHFLYHGQLDWYIPKFSQIGMQPVTYEEFCPIQSKYDSVANPSKLLKDTFGYQRPNHELVWYPDTVHGEFRLSLKDFLINRLFASRPELCSDFLKIRPEETNSIFNRTEASEDVILGQIVCKITAKRPIPRIVIPGLGR